MNSFRFASVSCILPSSWDPQLRSLQKETGLIIKSLDDVASGLSSLCLKPEVLANCLISVLSSLDPVPVTALAQDVTSSLIMYSIMDDGSESI